MPLYSPRQSPLTESLSGVSEPPLSSSRHKLFVPLGLLGTNPRVPLGISLLHSGIPPCIRFQRHRFQCDTPLASFLLPRSTPARQLPPSASLLLLPSLTALPKNPALAANDSLALGCPRN